MPHLTRPLAAVVLTAVGALLVPAPALAQSAPCTLPFADPDGLVSTQGTIAADDAAQDLADDHDLLVLARIIDTAGTGGLDAWAERELAACPSWQASDGAARNDLLLLVVAVEDRAIGSYFGTDVAAILDGQRDRVHAAMGSLLDQEQFADGVVLGLRLYADVFDQALLDGAADPGDADEGGNPLPWVLGGVVLVGGGAAGAIGLQRRRRRLGVRAEAEAGRTAAMNAYYDLEQRWETVDATVTVLTTATSADDGVAATVIREADEAERALAAVRDELLASPDPADLQDRATVDAALATWTRVVEQVEGVRREVDEVEAAAAALQQAREQAPARIDEAARAVADADAALDDLGRQELRADQARAWAADATRAVEAARQALADNRFGDAAAAASTAMERARQAAERAAAVPQLAADLPRQADDLEARADAVDREADEAERQLTAMRAEWRRTVWDDVSDAADRARELAAEARQLADEARAAAQDQDWSQALDALARGDRAVAEAAELAATPAQRHQEATAQLAEVRARFDRAHEELAAAQATIDATRADVAAQRSALRAAVRQLAKGDDLLGGKPDPLRAATIADEALAAITSALGQAQRAIHDHDQAVDRAERQLRDGRQQLRDAERASPSRGYQRDLDRAEDLLDEAAGLVERDPARAEDRARRGADLARDVLRRKRRARDGDRDDWRATPAQTRTRTSTPKPGGGFAGGGSTKRSSFGGGGSSSF